MSIVLIDLKSQALALGEHRFDFTLPEGQVFAEVALLGVPPGSPQKFGDATVLFEGVRSLGGAALFRGGKRGNKTGFKVEMFNHMPNGELMPRELYAGSYTLVLNILSAVTADIFVKAG